MSKEKQIEEMARIMTKFDGRMCERLPNSCLLSRYTHAQINCNFCKTAEDIYNAGYRKQSEGEWLNGVNGSKVCSMCGKEPLYTASGTAFATTFYKVKSNYCPNCGANMRKSKR